MEEDAPSQKNLGHVEKHFTTFPIYVLCELIQKYSGQERIQNFFLPPTQNFKNV